MEYQKEEKQVKAGAQEGTSVFDNSLIWFGAAVSIAEILTGTYVAPLGFGRGLAAIIIGHLIGCGLLFLAGLISAFQKKSAMESTKTSFGGGGAVFFAVLNVIQLVGWTAIMIFDGAAAAKEVVNWPMYVWAVLIGGLIIVWISVGVTYLGIINRAAMTLLFILSIVLCFVVFSGSGQMPAADGSVTFGACVELSAAMPLSWLPLIGDYTREAKKPVAATAASAVVYGVISCFMYVIGMGAALFTGETDIAKIMVKAGLGIAGLLIIVFSTVTTTFLDAYSAGISSETISRVFRGKWVAVGVTVIGILGAVFLPLYDITEFLYLIGSVFAPMIAVMISEQFVTKKQQSHIVNMIIWLIGFVIYRTMMKIDTPVGTTLPVMVITVVLHTVCVLTYRCARDMITDK